MGNVYNIMCIDCKEYFDLGSEIVWWQDEELMYCLKDFLLSHTDHELRIGGDEWNRAFDWINSKDQDNPIQLPSSEYKENDSKYSKEDFLEEKTAP